MGGILNQPVSVVGFNVTYNTPAPSSAVLAPSTAQFLAGPTIIGNFINWGLFGVLCLQIYLYYCAFPKDKASVKAIAYGVLAIQTSQLALSSLDAYEFLVYKGSIRGLVWVTAPIMGGFVAFLVQCFFAWRIALLSKAKVLTILVSFIAAIQFIMAVAAGVFMAMPQENGNALFASVAGWLLLSVLCDLIIAISMLVLLIRARGVISSTDGLLSKLTTLAIETGALTATGVVINVLLFWFFRNGGLYVLRPAGGIFLGNLYANTLLVNLNQRIKIVGGRGHRAAEADNWSTTLGTTGGLEFSNAASIGSRFGRSSFGDKMVRIHHSSTSSSVSSMV